jgi:hypothetical protein
MVEALTAARALAARLRYIGDARSPSCDPPHDQAANQVREFFYHSGIEISSDLTPTLWQRLIAVCERLKLPPGSVNAFIHASHELQAACLPVAGSNCIIRFSSGLIDLLEDDEFEFVAGHELGHFLLGHSGYSIGHKDISPEYFIRCRSQEISVDRIGLHACGSLDTAIRALMKTVSGLTSRHLRFDVGAFIGQLRKIEPYVTGDQASSTHPSILIRSKALLWYSLSDFFLKGEQSYFEDQIRQIDARIDRDLSRFVDGTVKRRIQATKDDLLLWMLTQEIVQHGEFSKKAQFEMQTMFDVDTITRLRSFLSDGERKDIEAMVYQRVRSTRQELERVSIPRQSRGL